MIQVVRVIMLVSHLILHIYTSEVFLISNRVLQKRMDRLPYPYGDCEKDGKTEDFIYRDKTYSTEVCHRIMQICNMFIAGLSTQLCAKVSSQEMRLR